METYIYLIINFFFSQLVADDSNSIQIYGNGRGSVSIVRTYFSLSLGCDNWYYLLVLLTLAYCDIIFQNGFK